jgi:hypothetical protein
LTFPLRCRTHLHQEYSRHKAASAIIRRGAAEDRMPVICRCGTVRRPMCRSRKRRIAAPVTSSAAPLLRLRSWRRDG